MPPAVRELCCSLYAICRALSIRSMCDDVAGTRPHTSARRAQGPRYYQRCKVHSRQIDGRYGTAKPTAHTASYGTIYSWGDFQKVRVGFVFLMIRCVRFGNHLTHMWREGERYRRLGQCKPDHKVPSCKSYNLSDWIQQQVTGVYIYCCFAGLACVGLFYKWNASVCCADEVLAE